MSVEGGFVVPRGMNEESARGGFFLVEMDDDATGLAASWLQERKQLAAQRVDLAGLGVKAHESVERQGAPSFASAALRCGFMLCLPFLP